MASTANRYAFVAALNEGEKDRLICVHLNTIDGQTNWEKAATEFGSASVESMKKCVQNIMKKLNAKAGETGVSAGDGPTETASSSPVKKKPTAPRKRKAAAADVGDDTNANKESTPKRKAPRKKGKAASEPAQESAPGALGKNAAPDNDENEEGAEAGDVKLEIDQEEEHAE